MTANPLDGDDTGLAHSSPLAFTEDTLGISNHLGDAAHAADLAGALGLPSS